jgi:hypothetical protein
MGPRTHPSPAPFRRPEATLPDIETTNAIASRIRREVAIERASESEPPPSLDTQPPVVVVVGPDGVPEIADEPGEEPATIRWEDDGDASPT